jgi:soluble lytic murein transglycosylase
MTRCIKSGFVLAFRWFCLLLAVAGFNAFAAPAKGDQLALQRAQFMLVWEAAQHGPEDAWRKLAPGLKGYPLYPYLELAALQRKLTRLEPAEARKFIDTWPDSLPALTLREAYLPELARRHDWKNFLALYADTTRNKELQCDALVARTASGETLDFKQDIEPLWLSKNILPGSCDDVFASAQAQNKFAPALIWQRIDLAAAAANAALVGNLAGMLDDEQRGAAERIAAALRDPVAALDLAAAWPDAPHTRDAVALAVERLARHDSDAAELRWNKLAAHFHFDSAQRDRILHALALYPAASYAPGALAKLEALPASADDDATREWHVRTALAAQDWKETLSALNKMSDTQKADARWRYLHARVLVKLGRKDEATAIFAGVAQEANFHGFLAADWLDQPYVICATQLDMESEASVTVRKHPGLVRAFEFFALDRLREARHEWDFSVAQLDPQQRRLAAAAASELGWYDRAVYVLNQGDDLHLYDLRFPLARREQIERDAQRAGIDPAWAYAIIRAESAWTSDAKSGADAWGLMQLLPGTAKQLAKVEKVAFSTAADLFDPDLNVRLGTRYLADMALHFDGSPWLASAAYNAGADPVGRWIGARDALEPDFFIETIPYKETREYVARVLAFSVIYDWRLHGDAQTLASRLPRIGQAYAPPAADAPRKAVICPAAKPAAAAAAIAAPAK